MPELQAYLLRGKHSQASSSPEAANLRLKALKKKKIA
jgi:hypothetical protein